MLADLHIHTHLSDGAQTPEEVAAEAGKKGLHVISVCDHNTIKAYKRLRPACEKAGLRLVQGVELDVAWRERTLHLLGYNFNPENAALRELMDNPQAFCAPFPR
jgi:predicted metal-dependent phosphoesterase TrpH